MLMFKAMGLWERLAASKDSRLGDHLKHLPVLRPAVLSMQDPIQRRIFGKGLNALEAELRRTRPTVRPAGSLRALHNSREDGEEFSRLVSAFDTSKLHTLGYQYVYGPLLLGRMNEDIRLLEIGIGTTNQALPSAMADEYIPGTSLRAWRALFPRGEIYGADIDERILFSEERIKCFWVDQRNRTSLLTLRSSVGEVDVIVDDGLHIPEAAINSMRVLLPAIRPGGAYVLEDALGRFDSCWRKAELALRPWFETMYYSNSDLNEFRESREYAGVLVVRRS